MVCLILICTFTVFSAENDV